MIEKQRLEELIEQGATIYSTNWNEEVDLSQKCEIAHDGIGREHLIVHEDEEHHPSYLLSGLTEDVEAAKWEEEFGCIERTENLKLLPYEEICDGCDYDFVFTTPNHCRVTMFIGGNEIFMYKGISSSWSWELTKENYTLACRKAKELYLGENNDKENS